jgi:hypothetical protein
MAAAVPAAIDLRCCMCDKVAAHRAEHYGQTLAFCSIGCSRSIHEAVDSGEVTIIGRRAGGHPVGEIKKSHEGRFTGWAQRHGFSGPTLAAEHAGEHSKSAAVRKQAQFAENARHWNHNG